MKGFCVVWRNRTYKQTLLSSTNIIPCLDALIMSCHVTSFLNCFPILASVLIVIVFITFVNLDHIIIIFNME